MSEGSARNVRLDATGIDVDDPAAVAALIPAAHEVPAGTCLAVAAIAVERRTGIGRWLGDRTVPVSTAVRCTALLVRGYGGIAVQAGEVRGYSAEASTGDGQVD